MSNTAWTVLLTSIAFNLAQLVVILRHLLDHSRGNVPLSNADPEPEPVYWPPAEPVSRYPANAYYGGGIEAPVITGSKKPPVLASAPPSDYHG